MGRWDRTGRALLQLLELPGFCETMSWAPLALVPSCPGAAGPALPQPNTTSPAGHRGAAVGAWPLAPPSLASSSPASPSLASLSLAFLSLVSLFLVSLFLASLSLSSLSLVSLFLASLSLASLSLLSLFLTSLSLESLSLASQFLVSSSLVSPSPRAPAGEQLQAPGPWHPHPWCPGSLHAHSCSLCPCFPPPWSLTCPWRGAAA